jgi:hypothetical protein
MDTVRDDDVSPYLRHPLRTREQVESCRERQAGRDCDWPNCRKVCDREAGER